MFGELMEDFLIRQNGVTIQATQSVTEIFWHLIQMLHRQIPLKNVLQYYKFNFFDGMLSYDSAYHHYLFKFIHLLEYINLHTSVFTDIMTRVLNRFMANTHLKI